MTPKPGTSRPSISTFYAAKDIGAHERLSSVIAVCQTLLGSHRRGHGAGVSDLRTGGRDRLARQTLTGRRLSAQRPLHVADPAVRLHRGVLLEGECTFR